MFMLFSLHAVDVLRTLVGDLAGMRDPMHAPRYNLKSELDAPGEYFIDRTSATLSFIPSRAAQKVRFWSTFYSLWFVGPRSIFGSVVAKHTLSDAALSNLYGACQLLVLDPCFGG